MNVMLSQAKFTATRQELEALQSRNSLLEKWLRENQRMAEQDCVELSRQLKELTDS